MIKKDKACIWSFVYGVNLCLHILRSKNTVHLTVSLAPVFCLHISHKEILGAQG